MKNIKLFADSTCDLPSEHIIEMDIGIVPLLVTFEDKTYRDGIDITPSGMFDLIDKYNVIPKTASPSPNNFYEAFKPYIDKGNTIIYIGLSSKISSTMQNAKLAASQFPKGTVRVVDSLNLCGAISGLLRYAYNFILEGLSVDEIVNNIENIIPQYKLFFTIETLDYLHMGGRCSSVENIFGSMLNIKPIINMSTAGLSVWKKTRGKPRAIEMMINQAVKDRKNFLKDEFHIACAAGNEKEMKKVERLLRNRTGINTFYEYTTGCVISSHCGKGTIGFGYFLKQ